MNSVELFLVDDDEDDRELFQYALRAISFNVNFTYATSGPRALQQLQQLSTPPDYIFLDMHMPGMNGCECLAAIRKIPAFKTVPVIIYSANSMQEYEQLAQQLQARHYMVKPYRSSDLTRVLEDLLAARPLPFVLQVCDRM